MLHGSEAWYWGEKEMATSRRTERAIIRAMCGVKLQANKSKKYHRVDGDVGCAGIFGVDG